jgi:hypothetical protein
MAAVHLVGTEQADPGTTVAAFLLPGDRAFWASVRKGDVISVFEGRSIVGEAIVRDPLTFV